MQFLMMYKERPTKNQLTALDRLIFLMHNNMSASNKKEKQRSKVRILSEDP